MEKYCTFIFASFLSVLSHKVSAQLEFVPPITGEIRNSKNLSGVFLLDTRDFHVQYGARNFYPSGLQVIDPLNPWPPIFFVNAEPGGKGLMGNGFYQNFHFHNSINKLTFYKAVLVSGNPFGFFIMCDTNFAIVDSIIGADSNIDSHDLQINDKGERLCMVVIDTILDLAPFSKNPADTAVLVTSQVIEILDQNNSVIFHWNPHDHLPITDTYRNYSDFTESNVFTNGWDWVHGNSIRFTHDGNIIYSFKYTGVGKINRKTGEIMWKLGGKSPTIMIPEGGQYFHQHDFHEIEPGLFSLYSNGDKKEHMSTAFTYSIDEQAYTANISRIYKPSPQVFSIGFGNYQTGENGLCLFNVGKYLNLEERQKIFEIVDASGLVYAEYSSPSLNFSYRVQHVTSWIPVQPVILNESGVLKLGGVDHSVSWYLVNGTGVIHLSDDPIYKPLNRGTYVATKKVGFGWIVSKPYVLE